MRYEAESTLEGISAAQQAAKRLTTMCLPAITDVLAAQQHDAVTQSYRAQLLNLGTTGGKAKLRAQGIDEKRICELSQYSTLDESQVLRYSPALAHYYNSEGLPCDADGALIAPTTATEDRERAMTVVPKVLHVTGVWGSCITGVHQACAGTAPRTAETRYHQAVTGSKSGAP